MLVYLNLSFFDRIIVGSEVCYVDERASVVNPSEIKTKGCDASNLYDEEIPQEEQEVSDDEAETKLKRGGKHAKRRTEDAVEDSARSKSPTFFGSHKNFSATINCTDFLWSTHDRICSSVLVLRCQVIGDKVADRVAVAGSQRAEVECQAEVQRKKRTVQDPLNNKYLLFLTSLRHRLHMHPLQWVSTRPCACPCPCPSLSDKHSILHLQDMF